MLTQITSLLSLAPKAETASTPTPTRGGTDFSEIFNQLAGQTPDKDAEPKAVDPELELAEGVPHPDNTDEDPSNPGKLSVGADMGNAFEDEAEFDLPFLRRQTAEDDTMPAAWFRSARNAASSGPIQKSRSVSSAMRSTDWPVCSASIRFSRSRISRISLA